MLLAIYVLSAWLAIAGLQELVKWDNKIPVCMELSSGVVFTLNDPKTHVLNPPTCQSSLVRP